MRHPPASHTNPKGYAMSEHTVSETTVLPTLDAFQSTFRDKIVEQIESANRNVTALASTGNDRSAVISSLIANADQYGLKTHVDKVTKLRDMLADAEDALNKAAGPKADDLMSEAVGNREALETTVKAEAKAVDDYIKAYGKMLRLSLSEDETAAVINSMPSLVSAKSGKGNGTRTNKSVGFRIRNFDFYVNGTKVPAVAVGKDAKPSHGTIALIKATGSNADDIRAAFSAAQGTDDSSQFRNECTFTLTVVGSDGNATTYDVGARRNVSAEVASAAADNGASVE